MLAAAQPDALHCLQYTIVTYQCDITDRDGCGEGSDGCGGESQGSQGCGEENDGCGGESGTWV